MKNFKREAILFVILIAVMFYGGIKYRLFLKESRIVKIAVFKINEEITSNLADFVIEKLESIKDDEFYKGIILEINSGGGELYAGYSMAKIILELKEKKFVISNIKIRALSAAYLIASAANLSIASDISDVGNIGVIGNFSFLNDESNNIISNRLKLLFADKPEEIKEFRKMLQKNIDNDFKKMRELIAEGRKIEIAKMEKITKKAWIYTAEEAKKLGLIDEIIPNNSRQNIINILLKKLNLKRENVEIIEFHK